jgi:hypothetical protein
MRREQNFFTALSNIAGYDFETCPPLPPPLFSFPEEDVTLR